MSITNLSATAFAISFAATAYLFTGTAAFAACNQNGCNTSTSYGSTFGTSTNCPVGTKPSTDGTCRMTQSDARFYGVNNTVRSSYARTSYASSTPLASYGGQSSWTSRNTIVGMSQSEASARYGTGSISASYSDANNTIVPFTATTTNISNHKIAGMGENEFLTPTTCPVNVYTPSGAKVLGCYAVAKPAPTRVRVRVTTPSVRTVRVVRPIIYVRYPVPVPVPFPVYTGYNRYSGYTSSCSTQYATRYGYNWPGRPCG